MKKTVSFPTVFLRIPVLFFQMIAKHAQPFRNILPAGKQFPVAVLCNHGKPVFVVIEHGFIHIVENTCEGFISLREPPKPTEPDLLVEPALVVMTMMVFSKFTALP